MLAHGLADVVLRDVGDRDRAFLEALFVENRWAEFDVTGWPDEVRRRFLAGQFALQSQHYASAYAGGTFQVIERDGAAIGRLYLFEGAADIRIVDIALLPQACGAGIGTALLRAVQARAAAAGKSASIHVEQNNPARRLYQRLGFAQQPSDAPEPYLYMEWR